MYHLPKLLLVLLLVSGCTAQPFARLGAYHRADNYSGNTHTSDTIFKSELGVEWEHSECAWSHLSELDRGFPFNHESDQFGMELLGCSITFGGR